MSLHAHDGAAVYRQADRAGHHLRRPGGDRDRERAAVRRGAGAHARTAAVGRGAARARRGQPGRQLDGRFADRADHDRRQGGAASGTEAARSMCSTRPTRNSGCGRLMGWTRSHRRASRDSISAWAGRGRRGASNGACRSRFRTYRPIASAILDVIVRAGFRALLIVPLARPDRIVGALVVRRKEPGEFPKSTIELLQTFADAVGAGDPECATVRRDRGEEPPACRGEPAQVAVPRQYEPRAAHAAQRHHRRHRDAAGGCGGAKAGHSSRSIACLARAGICSP